MKTTNLEQVTNVSKYVLPAGAIASSLVIVLNRWLDLSDTDKTALIASLTTIVLYVFNVIIALIKNKYFKK